MEMQQVIPVPCVSVRMKNIFIKLVGNENGLDGGWVNQHNTTIYKKFSKPELLSLSQDRVKLSILGFAYLV